MNKGELVSAMAEKSGLTKVDSEKALNAVISSISGTLKKGGKVTLVGFGTFSVSHLVLIAAKKVAKFKPGADLSL